MKPSRFLTLALAATVALGSALVACAGPLNKTLDCSEKKGKRLDSDFERHPHKPQTIFRDEGPGLRFYLPPEVKDLGQTMLYSRFAVAGDFEISVSFDGFNVAQPTMGYGASCGIAVDTETPEGTPGLAVSFARVSKSDKGEGFIITLGTPRKDNRGLDYEDKVFEPDRSKKGRLMLKRVRDKLTCLAGDGPINQLSEIGKLKFTEATVKKFRIYADQGKSPTLIDVQVSDVLIRAEEITHDTPVRDQVGWFWWLIAGAAFVVVAGAAVYFYLRQQRPS